MPTRGSTQADYDDLLGEVAEVMCKYDCIVIWSGDINADARCSPQSSNDKMFKKICMQSQLQISQVTPDVRTYMYHHFNGHVHVAHHVWTTSSKEKLMKPLM